MPSATRSTGSSPACRWRSVLPAANRAFEGIRLEDGWSNDFGAVVRSKDRLVASLRKSKYGDVLGLLKGVDYVRGFARFVGPHEARHSTHRAST